MIYLWHVHNKVLIKHLSIMSDLIKGSNRLGFRHQKMDIKDDELLSNDMSSIIYSRIESTCRTVLTMY